MNPFDVVMFAWNALKGHKLRSVLSMIGVSIGVTSVVLLTALGEGARTYVTGELATLGSNLVIVLPGKVETTGAIPAMGGTPNDLTLEDVAAVKTRVPRVRRVAPLTFGQALASYQSRSRNTNVIGTTYEFQAIRRLKVSRGTFLPPGDMRRGAPVCVIGTVIQKELFPGVNPLGRILHVGEFRFRIIGVLEPKGTSMGFDIDDTVLIPVASAMKVFNLTTLFRIFVEANSYSDLESVKENVLRVLIERHNDEEDVTLITQDSVLSSFNEIFTALTLALAGIAAISLTVAGIGIMNVMLVSVSERTPEIGLLKAVGVKSRQVVLVFLAEAALLSFLGGITGLIAATFLVDLAMKIFPALPAAVPNWAVVTALAVALGVGIIFGVWPARRASKLDPIQALAKR
ncbi:MAG TPA: ABC transporter permease [Acidobacteriota bacterium]|nr:ABC transporter permease [Acidobacteriota bacterium]